MKLSKSIKILIILILWAALDCAGSFAFSNIETEKQINALPELREQNCYLEIYYIPPEIWFRNPVTAESIKRLYKYHLSIKWDEIIQREDLWKIPLKKTDAPHIDNIRLLVEIRNHPLKTRPKKDSQIVAGDFVVIHGIQYANGRDYLNFFRSVILEEKFSEKLEIR